jgi:hypothetical protein
MTTKAEIAAAIRAALDRYDSGEERLWMVVNNVGLASHELAPIDGDAADQLRLLLIDLNIKAVMEEEGHAPGGPALAITLTAVRRIADALGT